MFYSDIDNQELQLIVSTIAEHIDTLFDKKCLPLSVMPGRCILYALTVKDVLHHFGYSDATLLPVITKCKNRGGHLVEILEAEIEDKQQLETATNKLIDAGAKIVILGDPDEQDKVNGWAGHLVTLCQGYLIDLSLPQANRPSHHIVLTPSAVTHSYDEQGPAKAPFPMISTCHANPDVQVAWYANPDNQRWQSAKNAMPQRRIKVVKKLINKITHRMKQGELQNHAH